MTKELRELLQRIEAGKAEVRSLLAEDKVDEAEESMKAVRALQRKVEVLRAVDDLETASGRLVEDSGATERNSDKLEAEYRSVFLKGIRRKRITAEERSIIEEYEKRTMHEGGILADPDGDVGLVVPQDLQTQINTISRDLADLSAYVRIETVNTLSGSRVLESDEDMTPFAPVEEYGEIQNTDNPKFTNVPYKLVKRAGILPLTNELLKDSDQNIMAYIAKWIARKHVVTKNSLILALLGAGAPVDIANLKALKKLINVELDPAIARTGVILTNQDGYNWLDEQEDQQGRPLLQPDITQPGRYTFKGLPVVPIANRHAPSRVDVDTFAPFFVGNTKEAAVLFTNGRYELASTREGGDAWRRDSTELRVITRDDLVEWDTGAFKFAEVKLA